MTIRRILAGTVAAMGLGLTVAASAQTQPADDPLPAAPGKDVVVRVCTSCHEAAEFAFARHTSDEWESVVGKMQDAGAEMTSEEQAAIIGYLAKAFPKAPAAAPANP